MKKNLLIAFVLTGSIVLGQNNGAHSTLSGATINPEIENLGGFKPEINQFNPNNSNAGVAFGADNSNGGAVQQSDGENANGYVNTSRTAVVPTYSLYPNPAYDHVIVEFETRIAGTLQVLNLVGQVIYQAEMNNSMIRIELQDLEPGVYFISVTSGEERIVKKLKVQ